MNQVIDYLVYFSLRGFLGFLRLIPLSIGRKVGRSLGSINYFMMRGKREMGYRHLKAVFGKQKSDKEIKKILKEYFQNLFVSIVELAHFINWDKDKIQKRILFEGLEHYEAAARKGKGIIFVTAHFGNFGLLAHSGSFLEQSVSFVVRKGRYVRVNKYLLDLLCRFGNKPVLKGGAIPKLEKALREGNAVGFMMDQRSGKGYSLTQVDLFGAKISLNKGPAFLAARTGAPVVPVFIFRGKNGTHRVEIGEEIPLVKTSNEEADLKINMNRMVAPLEKAVRTAPDHWLYWAWKGSDRAFQEAKTYV